MGEAQTEHEVHQEHQKLVRALADQHALADVQDHDEGVPDEAFDILVERAQALMAYEKQMPALLAEPERVRSQKVIFWSWRVQSAVAITLIVAFRLLGYSDWWYALVVLGVLSPWFIVAFLIGWAVVVTAVADGQGAGK